MTIEIDFNTVIVFLLTFTVRGEDENSKGGRKCQVNSIFLKFLLFIVSYKNYSKSQGCIVRPLLQVHSSEEEIVLKSFWGS